MTSYSWANMGLINGLLPDGTKQPTEPHRWGSMVSRHFHKKYSIYLSLTWNYHFKITVAFPRVSEIKAPITAANYVIVRSVIRILAYETLPQIILPSYFKKQKQCKQCWRLVLCGKDPMIQIPWSDITCHCISYSSADADHISGLKLNIYLKFSTHIRVIRYLWSSYQIRKIAGAHAPGMPEMFSPPSRISDLDMHHGTCVTHVPWCMPRSLPSSSLWSRQRGKTFPTLPALAQPAILRIWQEDHCDTALYLQCVYNPSSQAGLRLGDYRCVCSSSSVTASVNTSIPGVKAEVEYYRLLHGHTSEYNNTFGACQPCTLGCPGVPCEDSGQCGMTLLPDMAVRLPLVIITAFTMVAMVILMGMTCKLKKHKVRIHFDMVTKYQEKTWTFLNGKIFAKHIVI